MYKYTTNTQVLCTYLHSMLPILSIVSTPCPMPALKGVSIWRSPRRVVIEPKSTFSIFSSGRVSYQKIWWRNLAGWGRGWGCRGCRWRNLFTRERESGDFFFYSERWSKVKQVLNAKSKKIAAAGVGAAAASSLQIRNIWPKRSRKRFHNKKVKFHDETDVQKMF